STPSTSAAPRPCAKPRESRSRTSSSTWRIGLRKTATPCSASSIAISAVRKVLHEAPHSRSARCRSVCGRGDTGWVVPGPGRPRSVSLARAETLLPAPLHGPRVQAIGRTPDYWSRLLHPESPLETDLVSARLWL